VKDHRAAILEWAHSQVGPGDRATYWISALGRDPGPKLAWCGAFCLAALHAAGLALDLKWSIGVGFIGPAHLKATKMPQRGDICYLDKPFQHHFLFDYEYDGWVHSVDGNQPDVRERSPLLPEDARETDQLPPKAHPTLREGSVEFGSVRYLQSLLPGCKVDGRFGPVTKAYIVAFQAAAGLIADGVVGTATWRELEEGK
jgi:peptidoglycan hydrolase-like protein with peptidoglycan-binding domain